MNEGSFDLLVVGGGIVGAACAVEGARAGLRVGLFEAGVIGGGATAAGMGHLVVMDDSEAQFALTRHSLQLWRELVPQLPVASEYHPCGTLWVAADEEEMAEVRRKYDFYRSREVAVEILDVRQLAAAEPKLRSGMAGGLLVPGDAVVYSPVVARYLVEQALLVGAEVREGVSVVEMRPDGVTLATGERYAARFVVNATGSWAPGLTPGIPVQKRKGHLVITDRYPGFLNHQLIELGYLKSAHSISGDSVAFNVQPRQTGQILIGSSRQFGVDDPVVEQRMLRWMIERALSYMPELASLTAIRSWTGFRAATPDSLPLIGPVETGSGRLWLATGHEGLGITTSLGTAELLVDQLLGRPSRIPAAPYLPTRSMPEAHHD
jgi:glycine/D-amino acid oxidase-like deaminating enzyme